MVRLKQRISTSSIRGRQGSRLEWEKAGNILGYPSDFDSIHFVSHANLDG